MTTVVSDVPVTVLTPISNEVIEGWRKISLATVWQVGERGVDPRRKLC
jgi:hypothetical protein